MALKERNDRCVRSGILADRKHLEAAALGQLIELRELLNAGRAPARPEVHKDWFSGKVGKLHRPLVRVIEHDLWHSLALVLTMDTLGSFCPCRSGGRLVLNGLLALAGMASRKDQHC